MQEVTNQDETLSTPRLLPNTRSFFEETEMLTLIERNWFISLSVVGTFIPPVNWLFCVLLRQRKDTYRKWYLYNRILSLVELGVLVGVSNWYLYEHFFGRF